MHIDLTLHERVLRLFTTNEIVIGYALERIRYGEQKYAHDDRPHAARNLLAEAREEVIDGLNRYIMHIDDAEAIDGPTAIKIGLLLRVLTMDAYT